MTRQKTPRPPSLRTTKSRSDSGIRKVEQAVLHASKRRMQVLGVYPQMNSREVDPMDLWNESDTPRARVAKNSRRRLHCVPYTTRPIVRDRPCLTYTETCKALGVRKDMFETWVHTNSFPAPLGHFVNRSSLTKTPAYTLEEILAYKHLMDITPNGKSPVTNENLRAKLHKAREVLLSKLSSLRDATEGTEKWKSYLTKEDILQEVLQHRT